jgi:hypothetical protein
LVLIKSNVMTKKKNEKKVAAIEAPKKIEMINIFKTTYHRYRHWIRFILTEGKINKFRFVKDEVGYTGNIAINKPEVEAAKKVLADYKTKNKNTVEMWW